MYLHSLVYLTLLLSQVNDPNESKSNLPLVISIKARLTLPSLATVAPKIVPSKIFVLVTDHEPETTCLTQLTSLLQLHYLSMQIMQCPEQRHPHLKSLILLHLPMYLTYLLVPAQLHTPLFGAARWHLGWRYVHIPFLCRISTYSSTRRWLGFSRNDRCNNWGLHSWPNQHRHDQQQEYPHRLSFGNRRWNYCRLQCSHQR